MLFLSVNFTKNLTIKKRVLITWNLSKFDQAFWNERKYCQIIKQRYLSFPLASFDGLFIMLKYPCNEQNVKCEKKTVILQYIMHKFRIYILVVQVTFTQQNNLAQYSNIHYWNSSFLIQARTFNGIYQLIF